jgi:hypothetical protein
MKTAFSILLLCVIVGTWLIPSLLELDHHHDGVTTEHSSCNGDCGCLCHGASYGILWTDHFEFYGSAVVADDPYQAARTNPPFAALDRPPKLLS